MSAEVPWPYGVLGLETTHPGRAEVRRAYAARLRQMNPDQDPQGFRALREAYEVALARAEPPAAAPRAAAHVTLHIPADPDAGSPDPAPPAPETPGGGARPAQIAGLDALLTRISTRDGKTSDAARLTSILQDPLLADPEVAARVERAIYSFLSERIHVGSSRRGSQFRFGQDGETKLTARRREMRVLLHQLDQQFGWMSDAVRMQRIFPAYHEFVQAARELQVTRREGATRQIERHPILFFPIYYPIFIARELFSGNAKVALWILSVVVLAWLQFGADYGRSYSPPVLPSVFANAPPIETDFEFLSSLRGPAKPSPETVIFLRDLARNQGFPAKVTSDVKLLALRNTLVRNWGKTLRSSVFSQYENQDELQYLLGVLITSRLTIMNGMGYLRTDSFQLSPGADPERATWRLSSTGQTGLWAGSDGFVIAGDEPAPGRDWQPVYPEGFVRMVLLYAGGNLRVVEGALGLRFGAFDETPALRFYKFNDIPFPPTPGLQVDLGGHGLQPDGIADNRWPVRAFLPSERACGQLTPISAGFEETALCE